MIFNSNVVTWNFSVSAQVEIACLAGRVDIDNITTVLYLNAETTPTRQGLSTGKYFLIKP